MTSGQALHTLATSLSRPPPLELTPCPKSQILMALRLNWRILLEFHSNTCISLLVSIAAPVAAGILVASPRSAPCTRARAHAPKRD